MKKDIKNIRASIRAKLQNKAKETNRPFAVQYLQPSPLFSITPNNFPTFISHKKLKK